MFNHARFSQSSLIRKSVFKTGGLILSTLGIFAGCKPSGGFSGGSKKEASAPQPGEKSDEFIIASVRLGTADLVFLLDTSISMKEELNALENGLQGFVDSLSQGATGIDYQVFVIADTSKVSMSLKDGAKLDLRNSSVNSHSALWNAYHFLEGHSDKVPGGHLKLRDGAVKELIVLTDDDATDITSENFGPYLKTNKAKLGEVKVNGFVGLPTSKTTSTCKIASVGKSYISLSQDAEIGGFIRDVCSDGWSTMLAEFADEVKNRSTSASIFKLTSTPQDTSKIQVTVDEKPFADFVYRPGDNTIVVQTKNLSKSSHKVIVKY